MKSSAAFLGAAILTAVSLTSSAAEVSTLRLAALASGASAFTKDYYFGDIVALTRN